MKKSQKPQLKTNITGLDFVSDGDNWILKSSGNQKLENFTVSTFLNFSHIFRSMYPKKIKEMYLSDLEISESRVRLNISPLLKPSPHLQEIKKKKKLSTSQGRYHKLIFFIVHF